MSEFEQLYREVILDHYKTPRNHGLLDPNDAVAEGRNPLCGDEVTVTIRFGEGDVIDGVGFEGRGCAISQAATSMLTDLVKGRTAQDVAAMPKEELLDEISFEGPDLTEKSITIDRAYVDRMLADIVKNEDLSRYIL